MLPCEISAFSCFFCSEPSVLPPDKKLCVMKIEEKFVEICAELMENGVGEHKTFESFCSGMHADEMSMNNLFYEKFGMSGEDVFCKFLMDSIVIAV